MDFFQEEKYGEGDIEGLVVLGLSAWASITLLLMLIRSWTAGNWNWVAILSGLMCFSASLGTSAWRRLVLDGEGERSEEDAS